MAPAITDLALQTISDLTVRKGSKSMKHKRAPQVLNARRRFNILFSWARVNPNTFPYAILIVFIMSVLCTILMQILSEVERTTLSRRHARIPPSERLIAGLAYMSRMGIMYLFIVLLMTQNLYMLCTVLVGHLFGWVIFSAMGFGADSTEQMRLQQTIRTLQKEKEDDEEMKRKKNKKEKQLDNDMDSTTSVEFDDVDDVDDDDSQCDKRV